jgi:FAD/FMN-containing dehydrogenase
VKKTWSWGNVSLANHDVLNIDWPDCQFPKLHSNQTVLPYGNGRSYGDVPLNDGGILLNTKSLNRIISFDKDTGILQCEAGILISDIIPIILSHGWFLAVTPGTQFVTLGGAVANDVHGKNHHLVGSFGRHVLSFDLLRSDNKNYTCSREENIELFKATIGGLGLTGLITTVTIQLTRVSGSRIACNNIAFSNLDEGLELFRQYNKSTYTVAWIDCLSTGDNLGRGIFMIGEHCKPKEYSYKSRNKITVPIDLPGFTLNKWSVRAFNELYYRVGELKQGDSIIDIEPFFYPLDNILKWNKIYGKKGFFQHQCVIPKDESGNDRVVIRKMLSMIADSGQASFLAVLKTFGDCKSPGMLSFPSPGITLALDLPNKGAKTLSILEKLDQLVLSAGGKIYPAKDTRMSSHTFKTCYPVWSEFIEYIDPNFSSSFWRRVSSDEL